MPAEPPLPTPLPGDQPTVDWATLELRADAVRRRAWAPYSGFSVGAALQLADGSIVTGCNVENGSSGLTICAERSAVFAAVAGTDGPPRPVAMVVAAGGSPAPPCGACRQVLAEFNPRCVVRFLDARGTVEVTVAELLPFPFDLVAATGGAATTPPGRAAAEPPGGGRGPSPSGTH